MSRRTKYTKKEREGAHPFKINAPYRTTKSSILTMAFGEFIHSQEAEEGWTGHHSIGAQFMTKSVCASLLNVLEFEDKGFMNECIRQCAANRCRWLL